MSGMLPEDAWVNSFLPSAPRPLLTALQRRLAASTSHVNALADLFKQRAAIEQQYADSLSKLARTAESGGLIPKNGTDWERGGGEGKIWEAMVTDLAETSTAHSTLSALLKTDFEQPVRELPSKIVAWRRIVEQDASLDKNLKDYEKVSAKLEKAAGKSKSGKADAYQSELNQLTQSLSSLSPMVYTTYQRLDEQRLSTLKEIIVRWGTIKGDIAAKDGERAERGVGNLLGWETGDEVLAVGQKLGGSSGGGGRAGSAVPSFASTRESTREWGQRGGQSHPSSTDGPAQFDRRVSSATNASDFTPTRPNYRQNGSSTNVSSPVQPPSSFGGGLKSMLGRSKTLARGRSNSNATSVQLRDNDPIEAISEGRPVERAGSERPVDEEGFSVPPPDRHRSLWEEPDDDIPLSAVKAAPLVPSKSTGLAAPMEPTSAVPPSTSFPQTFEGSESQDTISSNAPSRINMAMTTAPIQESEEERQAALQKMQQTLQLPPQQPSRRNTTRGRRDVRNTMFGYNGPIPTSEEPEGMDGIPAGDSLSPTTPRQMSQSSTSNNPFESPALAAPAMPVASGQGLRANITEAINVIMRAGEIQRLQITGEIHLGLHMQPGTSHGPIHIRLDAFERLEKIAPNPQYLAQVPDKPGEYLLNSETLAGAASKATAKGTLLFKYQVHVSPGSEKAALPLFLEPVYLCKDGETRMILNYRTNPERAQGLSGLTIVAAFEPGPSVSNVQAKPAGGIWSPSTRRMTWEMGQLQGTDGKVIAKFTSDAGEPLKPQGVQASWAAEGVLASGIGIEVVGTDAWKFEEVTKGLSTGKYLAEAVINN